MEYRNKFKNYKDYLTWANAFGYSEEEIIKRFIRLSNGSFLDLMSKNIKSLSFETVSDYYGEDYEGYFCVTFPKGNINLPDYLLDNSKNTLEELFEVNDIIAYMLTEKDCPANNFGYYKYKYLVLTDDNIKEVVKNLNNTTAFALYTQSGSGWKKALIRYSNGWRRVSPYNR